MIPATSATQPAATLNLASPLSSSRETGSTGAAPIVHEVFHRRVVADDLHLFDGIKNPHTVLTRARHVMLVQRNGKLDTRAAYRWSPYNPFDSRLAACKLASLEDTDVRRIGVNPHNFKHDEVEALFGSSLTAQENRALEYAVAKLVAHEWLPAKAYLLAFGKSLAELVRKCYPEYRSEQVKMFTFHRTAQSGAILPGDNPFLEPSGRRPRRGDEFTLRELGASLAQTVAIGKDNMAFMRMLQKIKDDTVLRTQVKDHVDMDFFDRLCDTCTTYGKDDDVEQLDLPKTEIWRSRLYKEESSETDIRTKVLPKDSVKTYRVSELDLTSRELNYVGEKKTVDRRTGRSSLRVNHASQYAKDAIAKNRPTTSGPSGTTFHILLAAKLMAPAITRRLTGMKDHAAPFDWKSQSAKLLTIALMGYLHGENEAEHHHSMEEVLQGGRHADKLIRACYANEGDNPDAEIFGYDNYEITTLMAEIVERAQPGLGFYRSVETGNRKFSNAFS
jgi:hypothetical protein